MSSTKLKLSEYYEFVRWYATPRPYRSPRTQGEFSELWKVHPATLSEWKNDPNFEEDVRRTLYEWTHNLVPEVVGAIFNTAIRGDVKAQTLFMKYFSKLPNPDKDTPDELQRTGETLADILIARVKRAQSQTYAQQPEHLTTRNGN